MREIILCLIAFTNIAYSQIADSTKSVVVKELSIEDRKNIEEAGWELKQFTTWHYIGVSGMLAGGALSGIGAAVKVEGVIYAGIGLGIVGFLVEVFSHGFVSKAGSFLIKIGQ